MQIRVNAYWLTNTYALMQVLFPADIQDKIVNVERVLIFMIVFANLGEVMITNFGLTKKFRHQ